MIVIGLTGSIGTGKTTVTAQFATLGAATLDSDKVVHALLDKGGGAVEEVGILFPDVLEAARIDRKKLGAEVFGKPEKLKKLEAILHPLVRSAQDRFIKQAQENGKQIVVLDIPLLFETGGEKRCDYTVVTTTTLDIQRARVMQRPNMTQEKLERILAAQMPDAEKRSRADFVVDTGHGEEASLKAVWQILYRITADTAKKTL